MFDLLIAIKTTNRVSKRVIKPFFLHVYDMVASSDQLRGRAVRIDSRKIGFKQKMNTSNKELSRSELEFKYKGFAFCCPCNLEW